MILLAALAATAAPEEPACTARTAVPVTVAEIGERLDDYLGRCVTVSGPATNVALFSSVEGLYRSQRVTAEGDPDPGEARRHRLGLFSRDNAIRRLKFDRMPWMTVTGTVDSCERKHDRAVAAARERGEIAVIVGAGYCHRDGGAVVDAIAFSVDRMRKVRRLTGEAARETMGNLVQAPDDWPHLPALRGAAEEFLSALGRGDKAALAEMYDLSMNDARDSAFLDGLVAGTGSAFAEVRKDRSLPMTFFIARSDLNRARAGRLPGEPKGTLCFARAHGRPIAWPISLHDADHDRARPYACTSIIWRDWKKSKVGLDNWPNRGGWLAEPDPFT